MGDTVTLPEGWIVQPNGDVWDEPKRKPVVYKVSNGEWMVAGRRKPEELRIIAAYTLGVLS